MTKTSRKFRYEKARAIVAAGEIEKLPSGNFSCKTHAPNARLAAYQVNPERKTCQCHDFVAGHVCKHYLAMLMVKRQERLPARPLQRTYDELFASFGVSFQAAKEEAIKSGKPRIALIQRDIIAEREQLVKQMRPVLGEWVEELD